MDKLRIILLADIHLGLTVGVDVLSRIVEMANDLHPGLLLNIHDVQRMLTTKHFTNNNSVVVIT